MDLSEIFQAINAQYSLDNMVCLAEVETAAQQKGWEEKGYPLGFTRNTWEDAYPGIDVQKVYCPKSEFYPAELVYFDKEKYIHIFTKIFRGKALLPQEKSRDSLLKVIQAAEKDFAEKNYSALLNLCASEQSGNVVMSILKMMLEKEPPSAQLYSTFMNYYTFCDCGTGKLSLACLEKLQKCKTKPMCDETARKLKGFHRKLKVYRGEGSKSTPYTKAFSWTTDFNAAVFFASRRGYEKSVIYIAEVEKKDVFEYIDDRDEAEVFIFPEHIKHAKAICCVELDWFKRMITSPIHGFDGKADLTPFSAGEILKQSREIYQSTNKNSTHYHTYSHTAKVTLLASYMYRDSILTHHLSDDDARKALLVDYFGKLIQAALWHDVGRIDESQNESHGAASYQIYLEHHSPDAVIQFLVENHCVDDAAAQNLFNKQFAAHNDRALIWEMFLILKDADALDRVRFGIRGLDCNQLRCPDSVALVPAAVWLNEQNFSN